MATLYQRGKCWYLNFREDGRQVRISLGPIERREAQTLRAKKEAELRGLLIPTGGITIGSVIGEYLDWYKTARESTYKQAKSALKVFREHFAEHSAERTAPSAIERWAASGAAPPSQVEKALKLARAAFRRKIKQRELQVSPMDGVAIAKPMTSRAPSYFRPEDLARLRETPHADVWSFMVNTGIRRGEMSKARRSDVRNGMLHVESSVEGRTKSLRWRAIPLNAGAKAALKGLGKDRLIDSHRDTLSDWFRAEAGSVGVKGTLHWLRHTFCTALVQSGVSLHDVKQLAGHSSITVTEQYAHHAPGFGRAAVDTMAEWQDKHTEKHKRTRKVPRPRSSAG